MRHYLPVLFLSFTLAFSHCRALGQNIEFVLNTNGDVTLNGAKGATQVTTSESLKPAKDQMVKQRGDSKEVKIFTTPADAQKKKQHDKLDIQIPDRSIVSLRAGTGDVTLTDIDAYVSGRIKSGTLSLKNLRGEIELVNDQGDIEATGLEAKGMLMTHEGDIRLKDISGIIAPHAPKGRISVSISPEYYKKRPQPLDIELTAGDIDIESAPFGGAIRLGSGSLTISDIRQPLAIEGQSTEIVLQGLIAPLLLRNRGNVSVQLLPFAKEEGQMINIETENGDVTLYLGKGFAGKLQIRTTEVNPSGKIPVVSSAIDLGKESVLETKSEDEKLTVRETIYRAEVGSVGPIIIVRVTNGRVIVK